MNAWGFVLRVLIVGLLAFALLWVFTHHAYAAPYDPNPVVCRPDVLVQQDIAGTYESTWMKVDVFPCGGLQVFWINDYGEHDAVYFSEQRIPSGGVFLSGFRPDQNINAYLDGVPFAAFQPVEPGWVRFTSVTKEGGIIREYRLRKTS